MERSSSSKVPPLSWESPTTRLAGLGKAAGDSLAAFGIRAASDLLWTLPAGYDDLRTPLTVDRAITAAGVLGDARVVVRGIVESSSVIPMRGRKALRVIVREESPPTDREPVASAGDQAARKIHAWWFFFAHGIHKAATAGAPAILVGRLRVENKKPARMAHPDLLVGDVPPVRVRYPRFGVAAATLRKAIASLFDTLGEDLPDPVPHEIVIREGMLPAAPLLRAVHLPDAEPPSAATITKVRERIAWAEIFTRTFDRLRLEANASRESKGVALGVMPTARELEEAFEFSFTKSQRGAIDEIAADLCRNKPMRRLLLGDVGTGKTAVALAAVVQAVGSGAQAALLAPTTVLAEQYLDSAAPIVQGFGVKLALLTSATPAPERRRISNGLAEGTIDVVVGTHALLSADVKFAKLALVVVDEQHRLGVAQRLALVQKGARPHLLTLTATPIPRTLALALRGDLPVTSLAERPRGRQPVVTELVSAARYDVVLERIRSAVEKGEQVFVVCPRIEVDEEEEDAAASAVARADWLTEKLPKARIGLVHSSLGHVRKSEAMRTFRRGGTDVLVGTTVVEVGVDVPNATLMIVESAERFGLAQLHQLRGRVGRGSARGHCMLLHAPGLEGLGRERLEALARLDRGEDVARADLELRGGGDLWGTRQSGEEEGLVFLDDSENPSWLARIESDAAAILATDPDLALPEHRALRLAVTRFRTALSVREEAG